MKLMWRAEDFLIRKLSKALMVLVDRKTGRGCMRISVADAVAELSGMQGNGPVWGDVKGGMIDHLQRGWVEPFRSPEGELRFRLTDKGKAYAKGLKVPA